MKLSDTGEFASLFLNDTPLLDVRAPIEFGQGAFPNAINLPLLDDEERHEVGLRYKQAGQDAAILLGTQLVAGDIKKSRIESWLRFTREHPDGFLYCFRGGLRSRTTQGWLREHGVEYPLVTGGYKAMRRFLIDQIDECVEQISWVIIGGRTGSGKTILLKQLPNHIDLEELARHRGSSFGGLVDPQPTNINFENALSISMLKKKDGNGGPVFIEDESRMIGRVSLPEPLRQHMLTFPAVILETDLEERVEVSLQAYIVDLLELYKHNNDLPGAIELLANHHRTSLGRIRKRFGGANYNQTLDLLEQAVALHNSNGNIEGYRLYISKLLSDYYDPMYDYQLSIKERPILFRGTAAEIIEWSESVDTKNLTDCVKLN